MSLSLELMEVAEVLMSAEAEVMSIATTIKQVRHDHAVTLAGLEELLEQAEDDLLAEQEHAVKVAAKFAGDMTVQRCEKKRAS